MSYNSLVETRPIGSASASPLAQSKTKLRTLRAAAETSPPSTWVAGAAGGDGTQPERLHVNAELASDAKHVARHKRLPIVGSTEVQRVFGGGLTPGSLTLLAGDPGIGKSTLVMQLANWLGQALADNPSTASKNVLYVSGEETPQQLRSRAERLGVVDAHNVYVSAL
jgi:predicted ATP-dependent serine protease